MKVTEQKTKSLTFLFNKDEEYNSFIEVLFHGSEELEKANPEGWTGTPPSWKEVVDSIRRNILNGIPRVVIINSVDDGVKVKSSPFVGPPTTTTL